MTPNKSQAIGALERVVYAVISTVVLFLVGRNVISEEIGAAIIAGIVGLVGPIYAWITNTPVALMNAAANAAPTNTQLVLTPSPSATPDNVKESRELADASSAKVSSR